MVKPLVFVSAVLLIASVTAGCALINPPRDQGMSPLARYNPTGTGFFYGVGPGGGTGVE